jgi:hypothetical protein
MESKDPPHTNGADRPVAPTYDSSQKDGPPTPPTPPQAGPTEKGALGEAADVYGNIEDAENLGYVERG